MITITFQKVMTGLALLVVVWILLMTGLSIYSDGLFYHIESPVHVLKAIPEVVTLQVTRRARLTMQGFCARELDCDLLYQFGGFPCVLEAGERTVNMIVSIPANVSGECQIRGSVQYAPFGTFGPTLITEWESEQFQVPKE